MKKFRNIPAFVTLFAGFIGSVVMILQEYSLVRFLWILIAIMVGFYMVGLLLRLLLNKAFKDLEAQKEEDSSEEKEENDNQETSSDENKGTEETGEEN